MKSVKPKDEFCMSQRLAGGGRNAETDFHGQKLIELARMPLPTNP